MPDRERTPEQQDMLDRYSLVPTPDGKWHLLHNWGNYGVYGWRRGFYKGDIVTAPGWREQSLVLALGPWRIEWGKITDA